MAGEFKASLYTAAKDYLNGHTIPQAVLQQVSKNHDNQYVRKIKDFRNPTPFSSEERMGYVQSFFPKSCWANRFIFTRCKDFREFLVEKKERLVVASFGCGPGSECLALLDYVKELGVAEGNVHFDMFDSQDWSDAIEFFLPKETFVFRQTEVLEPEFIDKLAQMAERWDVLLFSKFACGIFYHPLKDRFYRTLFGAMKVSSFVVAVDKGSRGFNKKTEFLGSLVHPCYHCGFQMVETSYDELTGDDYDAELCSGEDITATKNLFSYRFLRKKTTNRHDHTEVKNGNCDSLAKLGDYFDPPWRKC